MLAVGTNQPPEFVSWVLPSLRTCRPLHWMGRWQIMVESPMWDVSGSSWKGPITSIYAPLARALSRGHVSLKSWELESSCVSGTKWKWPAPGHMLPPWCQDSVTGKDVKTLRAVKRMVTVSATAWHKLLLFCFPQGRFLFQVIRSGLVPSGSHGSSPWCFLHSPTSSRSVTTPCPTLCDPMGCGTPGSTPGSSSSSVSRSLLNSCPLSWWGHASISSSTALFFSYL